MLSLRARDALVHGMDRQGDREARSAALTFTLGAHGPAVRLDEVTHERQAQAEPAESARGGPLRLPEPIEDVGEELRRDPGARVAHDQMNVRPHALEAH